MGSERSGWSWLATGSLVQAAAYLFLFLVPFWGLWGRVPEPASIGSSAAAIRLPDAAMAALLFSVPSLLPFVWLVRMPPALASLRVSAFALALIALPAMVALCTYPCCGDDAIAYVNRQRLWAVHGGNPFFAVPGDHPEDWTYLIANQQSGLVAPYGPMWWLLGRLATQWAASLDQYFIGFKALAAVCFLISLALVWRLSPPERRVGNAVLLAWNPIIVVDGLVRVHNDLLPLPFALLGVWLWQRRAAGALAMLALGTLVKLTVAPVGLVVAASLARARRWRALLVSAALALAVAVAAYAPFWAGPATLRPLVDAQRSAQWSLGSALVLTLEPVLGEMAQPLVRVALAVVCAWLVWRVLSSSALATGAVAQLADAAALVTLLGLVLLPLVLYSHYLIPVVGLAALGSDARVRQLVLSLCVGLQVTSVLAVDSLLGGPTSMALDVTCDLVILGALVIGVARGGWLRGRWRWPRRWQPAEA